MVEKAILVKLKERQGNLSDYAYSEQLGISQQLWQQIRTEKKNVGITLLKAIGRTYPDMALDVLFFLGFDVSKVTSYADNTTNAPEKPQDRKISLCKRFYVELVRRFRWLRI